MRMCRRLAVVLVLIALLSPAILRASPARGSAPTVSERTGVALLGWLRSVLDLLWGEDEVLTGDNGPGFDPNGSRLTGDNGPGLDPNGSRLTGDNGPGLDPDGDKPTGDNGPGADPNG
jgi:hypothetical protein